MISFLTRSPLARKLLAAAAILLVADFALRAWLAARDDRLRLVATLEAQKQVIDAANRREREHADQLRQQLAAIDELKRRIATPQQIVRELPHYLPLPQPIQLPAPASRPPAEQGSALPEKPEPSATRPAAQLPVEDLKPLFDFVQDCRACQAELAAAKQRAADDRVKIDALTHERDAALHAARGGTFWTRARRTAKWFVIGAGVGAAVIGATRR